MMRIQQQDYIHDIPLLLPPNDEGSFIILIYDSLESRDEWRSLLEQGVQDFHTAACHLYDIAAADSTLATGLSEFLQQCRNKTPNQNLFTSVLGLPELRDYEFAARAIDLNQERESLRVEKCWLALWMTMGRMAELGRLAPDFLSCTTIFRPSFDQATLRDDVVERTVRRLEEKYGVKSDEFLEDWEHDRAEEKYPADWRTWLLYLQARREES